MCVCPGARGWGVGGGVCRGECACVYACMNV